jgi:HEPN domain-containing protein
MPETPDRILETLEWIRYGDEDWDAARLLLVGGQPKTRSGLFHCQQAAEKWLKALLIWRGIAVPRTHDLHRLAVLLEPSASRLGDAIRNALDLTVFATMYRYPGAELEIEPDEIGLWLSRTSEVRNAVVAELPVDPEKPI